MPHECYSLLKAYTLSPNTSLDEEHWGLVLDWLLTASQGDEKKKQSVLAMELDAVACDDFGMQEWMADHVDKTLGPHQKEPLTGTPPGPTPAVFSPRPQYPQHLLPIMGNIGAEIGRALGLTLKMAPQQASSHTRGMNMRLLWHFAMCNEHRISPKYGGALFPQKPSRSKFTGGSSNPRCLNGHTIIVPKLTQFSLNKKQSRASSIFDSTQATASPHIGRPNAAFRSSYAARGESLRPSKSGTRNMRRG